ncbi:hypothetical protein NFX39_00645 [Fructobacillus sp. W13]|uniref:Integral membrane protein n=1 Tax=Fructobacillus apis TaxID=2935017 RepID=A0ABT0ZNP3_9LACO|nr:hypothetical protein [Fructobacillus apis]MCO0831604.1 hypothetical protein [Fructobacillus apis]
MPQSLYLLLFIGILIFERKQEYRTNRAVWTIAALFAFYMTGTETYSTIQMCFQDNYWGYLWNWNNLLLLVQLLVAIWISYRLWSTRNAKQQ